MEGGYDDDENNEATRRLIAITHAKTFTKEGSGQVKHVFKCNIPHFINLQSDNVLLSESKAQTQTCNMYDFSTEDFELTLVDTPGLLDSDGIEKDKAHIKNIVNAVAALGDIHGVLLVHKGSDCREDPSLSYMIGEFKNMLP